MKVRPARPEDLEAIRAILEHPVSRAFAPDHTEMIDADLATCYVAESSEGVVGFCRFEPIEQDSYQLHILVHPEHHGKGHGSRLLETILARRPVGTKVTVAVAPHNGASLAFFMEHGFSHVGRTDTADMLERTLA